MRRYETIFILRPDLGEPQLQEAVKRFEGIVAAGGELIETDEWGFRELAYHIKGERRGYYIRLDYAADAATMNEVERNLKLHDAVLRFLSVLVEQEADVAKAHEEVEARKRRVAEAKAAAEARTQQRLAAAAEAEQRAREQEAAAAEKAEQRARDQEAAAAEKAAAAPAATEPAATEPAAEPEAPASAPESGGKQD